MAEDGSQRTSHGPSSVEAEAGSQRTSRALSSKPRRKRSYSHTPPGVDVAKRVVLTIEVNDHNHLVGDRQAHGDGSAPASPSAALDGVVKRGSQASSITLC